MASLTELQYLREYERIKVLMDQIETSIKNRLHGNPSEITVNEYANMMQIREGLENSLSLLETR
jgi:hypothetical protein